jgi:enterochelin esterase-like enzyme
LIVLAAGASWIGVRDWRRGYRSTRGARVIHFNVESSLTGRELHEILVVPAGREDGRELLVFLHGRSSSPRSNLRQPVFDALHDLARRAPVVLLADGGDHSYWHDRHDGAWGSSLVREVIPAALARSGADGGRVAIGGISMGGFGALDLARLYPAHFCAVGAHSAALWFRGADTPAGAFDDAEDFSRHDLIRFATEKRILDGPVWIDVGRADPFYRADVALARELTAHKTKVQLQIHGGGHSGWSGRMREYLDYYARACYRVKSASTPPPARSRGGRTSRHVHEAGPLSSRQRMNFVP